MPNDPEAECNPSKLMYIGLSKHEIYYIGAHVMLTLHFVTLYYRSLLNNQTHKDANYKSDIISGDGVIDSNRVPWKAVSSTLVYNLI